MNFADRLQQSIEKNTSHIVAGFDPRLETIPIYIFEAAAKQHSDNEESLYAALMSFYGVVIEVIQDQVAAVKPNIAFFESLGMAGLRAYMSLCSLLRDHGLLIIADAKRGDIGSTARAYSSAFLGRSDIMNQSKAIFDADALTVNPYLGFDTLEVYLEDCSKYDKGIFVLVKTSNAGSDSIQNEKLSSGQTVSQKVASWVAEKGKDFVGSSGYSSIGAVIGATYPEEAAALRSLMPNNFLLIPGMGAQGGTAEDAIAGFSDRKGGAVINVSRGLLSSFSSLEIDEEAMKVEIKDKLAGFNQAVVTALE